MQGKSSKIGVWRRLGKTWSDLVGIGLDLGPAGGAEATYPLRARILIVSAVFPLTRLSPQKGWPHSIAPRIPPGQVNGGE